MLSWAFTFLVVAIIAGLLGSSVYRRDGAHKSSMCCS